MLERSEHAMLRTSQTSECVSHVNASFSRPRDMQQQDAGVTRRLERCPMLVVQEEQGKTPVRGMSESECVSCGESPAEVTMSILLDGGQGAPGSHVDR